MTAHYHNIERSSEPVASSVLASIGGVIRPNGQELSFYRKGLKPVLDVVLVVLSLPLVVPFILALALLVALDGGKPFYSQKRVGRNGRIYTMYKLRTMVLHAEAKLQGHLDANPQARLEWDATQKLKDDPRITRFGRFLRKSSFDELPQLWNVLIGDMSLVGPRPMLPEQETIYPGTAYFSLRPGITGLWQIAERNNSSFADRAKFDTAYNRSMSLMADLAIIAATFKVVMRGTGY